MRYLGVLGNPMMLFTAAGIAATAVLLTLAVVRSLQNPAKRASFEEALRVIGSSELDIDTALNKTTRRRRSWGEYWAARVARSGKVVAHPAAPGRTAAGLAGFAALFGLLVFPRGPLGLLAAPPLVLAGYRAWLDAEARKRVAAMEKQLPQLLSGLRANLQAGSTAQQAIVSVADDLPSPLGDELRTLRRDMDVNVPLETALRDLARRVPSREMQFLVASIEIAVRSGAHLDPQLATIQDIVSQRTRIRQKLRAAVAQVKPTKYLAYGAVPAMFAVSLRSAENRAFWFGPGLLWLIVGAALYAAGGLVIRAMVRSVENT